MPGGKKTYTHTLEETLIETVQSEENKEKRINKNEYRSLPRNGWHQYMSNGNTRRKEISRKVLEKVTAKKLPNLKKTISLLSKKFKDLHAG